MTIGELLCIEIALFGCLLVIQGTLGLTRALRDRGEITNAALILVLGMLCVLLFAPYVLDLQDQDPKAQTDEVQQPIYMGGPW